MSPFIQMDTDPPAPQGDDPERWEVYTEQRMEKILASTNYHDAHARAWNQRSLAMVVGVRGVVTDAAGKPCMVRHGYAQGLTPEEMYACVAGARLGLPRSMCRASR